MQEMKEVAWMDAEYPAALREIGNAPRHLFYIGDIRICATPCIAIVGSRKATAYGKWAASELAKYAASAGITVVSGMAWGIDSAAHRSALEHGGNTIAVLGGGADVCYPARNRALYDAIKTQGLILSEQPPGQAPLAGMFPARNRIISGLCQCVVVVEAGIKSGSLITADLALKQNREVYAVPGNINCISSLGTNKLIQDGAAPVVVPSDILRIMNVDADTRMKIIERSACRKNEILGQEELRLLQLLSDGREYTLNELCEKMNLSVERISGLVSVLELKGLLLSDLGKIYIAN